MMKEQRALAIAARTKINKLKQSDRCSDACPGWAVFESGMYGLMIQRCDECFTGIGKDKLYDDEAAALPEAQATLREAARQEGVRAEACS